MSQYCFSDWASLLFQQIIKNYNFHKKSVSDFLKHFFYAELFLGKKIFFLKNIYWNVYCEIQDITDICLLIVINLNPFVKQKSKK